MSDSGSNNSGGIGLAGATFIVFLVLKLTHTIDWSWWWVTAPLWGPTVILLAIAGVLFILGRVIKAIDSAADKKTQKRRAQERAKRLRNL